MKRAIIVGASSGIGLEVARQLLADGWTVGACARREEPLLALQGEAPGRVEVVKLDVTQADAPTQLQTLIERLGGMDLYFHAAGIGWQNRTLEPDVELRTVETNAAGFTRMIDAAYRYFTAHPQHLPKGGEQTGDGLSEGGMIAAITSIAGTKGLGPAPAYSATKAFQANYLEALEQQARQRCLNIHVLDIRPGFVDTALLGDGFNYPMLMRPEDVARDIVRSIRKRRHVRIVDWRYRVLTFCWRLLPRWLWRRIRL
ncbi:MAG: SDR family NAD(P)-dependent oxidoreductase [Bacteroidaceae bacterium]|nr:SDR family NAD(P)-dependent oxidoreductase [Bacteroidaceae bacterium]